MSEPKRYHLYAGLECQAFTKAEAVLKFREEDDGIWVKWEDYACLKAEVDRLKEGNECLDQMHEKEMARSAFLCEEVNRTTAWGRGLESDLSWARAELLMVKAEVERLKNNIAYLDKKLDEELDK